MRITLELKRADKIVSLVMTVLIILTVIFIFSNSFENSSASDKASEKVTETVKPIVESVIGQGKVTNNAVRKTAHVLEFGLLGFELAILLTALGSVSLSSVMHCSFFAVTVALLDETIQIFNDRGALVKDVWIDFGGALSGITIALLIFRLASLFKKRRR